MLKNLLKNKNSLLVVLLLLLTLPAVISLSKTSQDVRKRAQTSNQEDNDLWQTNKTPEFKEGEVIVKLKEPISSQAIKQTDQVKKADFDAQAITIKQLETQQLPQTLQNLNSKYKIKSIEKVFKGAKEPAKEIQAFKNKFTQQINEGLFLKNDLSKTYKITVDPRDNIKEIVEDLEKNSDVEYAEPNYMYKIDTLPNDPDFSKLWGLNNTGQTFGQVDADIDAPEAWDITTGINTVIVGVIDTGIDYTHLDLIANIWNNPNEIPGNNIDDDNNSYIDDVRGWDFINNDNDPMDEVGHGTHVAGTIGAIGNNGIGIVGVNWNVKLMSLKFLGPSGGYSDDAAEAIIYATNMGCVVTNNSWGGTSFSQTLKDAISYAESANSLFVAAAGNNGANTDIYKHYPSTYDNDNIISVTASDHNDRLAYFSNFGKNTVDLAAPGLNIYSSIPPSTKYAYYSGTSMAAPHVTGAVALLISKNLNYSANQIKNILRFK